MRDVSVALVIPAYNEARRLGATLEAVAAYVERRHLDAQVIVVDDGSSDGTADVATACLETIPYLDVLSLGAQRGKGAAVRAGILVASADVIGFTDADLSTPTEELPRMLAALDAGYDLAIGSRALAGSQVVRAQPTYRRIGARIFRDLARAIGGLEGFPDSQCGFKFYRREVARDLYGSSVIDRWMFDLEILRLALHRGYRVAQIPVKWRDNADSRLRLTLDTYRMLRDLVRIRLRFWRGAYGRPGRGA